MEFCQVGDHEVPWVERCRRCGRNVCRAHLTRNGVCVDTEGCDAAWLYETGKTTCPACHVGALAVGEGWIKCTKCAYKEPVTNLRRPS
jgi:hypothetical protein